MLKVVRTTFSAGLLLAAGSAFAAERTVRLHVKNVSCVTCVPIVKRAIGRAAGVSSVTVVETEGGSAVATVTYDAARVSPEALAQAATDAGYPARVRTN
ncbi:MAG: cation transporter [Methylobacterium sp.]|uniref:heavy-metal-associated domain-containing protein n=1 Tax=Methylobacterium sp. TaxID=409 RepID=UPI0025FAE815|nr:cation transporter [Methylobacterium sp.]MBX9934327.1 cation transporter [Methylobacterium sp.]